MKDPMNSVSTRERRRTSRDCADGTDWELPDADCEVATVLESKRWERREEPFQGFDSPPGKF